MVLEKQLNYQSVLDGLGHAVLIFDSQDRLILDNLAARTILGPDLKVIRASGWSAAATLFNSRLNNPEENVTTTRKKALESARPVRFHMYFSGEYIPCWAAAVHGASGEVFTMITIETLDWSAMTDLLSRFRDEVQTAASATKGHTDLILQTLKHTKPNETPEQISRRVSGFVNLIATHMHRVERLTYLLERLEMVRTGRLTDQIRQRRKRVVAAEFVEDFIERLDEIDLLDPETETQDFRARIKTDVPDKLAFQASSEHLTSILQDILRNAIMYSMKATPVTIKAQATEGGQSVQLDITDEGYGIRASEFERVFTPYQRARQPQIIGEFGYGLSLYLCKYEVEAMNGKIWFTSEEGVGTTFSFKLPAWRETESSSSGSSPSKT
jgi:signal transduction histidine kinase